MKWVPKGTAAGVALADHAPGEHDVQAPHQRNEVGEGRPGKSDQLVPAGAFTRPYSDPTLRTDVHRGEGTTAHTCREQTLVPTVHRNGTLGRTPLIRVTVPEDPGVRTSEPAECLGLGVGGTRCPTSKWV
jgi:hypothetical protein